MCGGDLPRFVVYPLRDGSRLVREVSLNRLQPILLQICDNSPLGDKERDGVKTASYGCQYSRYSSDHSLQVARVMCYCTECITDAVLNFLAKQERV